MTKKEYNASSMSDLKPLESIRKRPGMYIYNTDIAGYNQLFTEIFDNSVDEAMNNHGTEIIVRLNADDSITVRDFGRGIPVDSYKGGVPAVEKLFSTPHMGGKFGDDNYKSAGGLHGVGSSVVLALSDWVKIKVYRDGYEHDIEMCYDVEKDYKLLKPLTKSKKVSKEITGTEVTFRPSETVFKQLKFKPSMLQDKMRNTAYLVSGINIIFIDDRNSDIVTEILPEGVDIFSYITEEEKENVVKHSEDINQYLPSNLEVFNFSGGISQFVTDLNEGKTTSTPNIYVSVEDNDLIAEVSLQWNVSYSERILSFVNNISTVDGGTHETAVKSALTKALNDYAKQNDLNKLGKKSVRLDGKDIREGLVSVISAKVPEKLLSFEGQTKGKLSTAEVRTVIEPLFVEQFTAYFNENPKVANVLIDKAVTAQKVREETKKARNKARGNKKDSFSASDKLTPCTSKDSEKNELFIVEGSSAGGTAKKVRQRKHQAILELRGKVLNTENASRTAIIGNKEIETLIFALGTGFGEDFDITKLKYHKIIIMTDADTDGKHIQILLLTFFLRHMKELVLGGYVYVATPPLYGLVPKKPTKTNVTRYAWTPEEVEIEAKKIKGDYELKRFKGLGEMDEEQLGETTLDIEKRTLIQVGLDEESDAEADKMFSRLMGDKPESRRKYLEKHADFVQSEE